MASIWYVFRPGNSFLSFAAGEALTVGSGGIRFAFDFSRFGPKQVQVSLAGLLRDASMIARVKVGGGWNDVSGTTILTLSSSNFAPSGVGNPVSQSAVFTNIWSGPQIVKLTGENQGGGASGSLLGGPTITFKVDE